MEDSTTEPAPRRRPRLTWRRWLPRAVFEAMLIVLSLLLALWLSEWQEDRRTAERVAEARRHVIAEIRRNRAIVASDAFLPHHERLRRELDQALLTPGGDPERAFRALFASGVHFAPFRDAVWRSISASDLLQELPPAEMFAIAEVYGAQEDLTLANRAYYPVLSQMPTDGDDSARLREALAGVRLYLGDVVAAESEIIAIQDEALRRLGAAPTPPPAPSAPADRRPPGS
ncbi:MAG TPA: hypothetical protein VGB49_03925 [Caulobacteraceae bacterium]|jgi:hypothetical protein